MSTVLHPCATSKKTQNIKFSGLLDLLRSWGHYERRDVYCIRYGTVMWWCPTPAGGRKGNLQIDAVDYVTRPRIFASSARHDGRQVTLALFSLSAVAHWVRTCRGSGSQRLTSRITRRHRFPSLPVRGSHQMSNTRLLVRLRGSSAFNVQLGRQRRIKIWGDPSDFDMCADELCGKFGVRLRDSS